jgi:transcriptional regulator with XRE-family HTH domain
MNAFDRLKKLCDKQGISVNTLEENLEIGKNSLYSWKKNIPKGSNLIKVADYFNVSTDYLLGRTDSPQIDETQDEITDDDYRKIERFARKLTPKNRKKAFKILEATFEDAFDEEEEEDDDDL